MTVQPKDACAGASDGALTIHVVKAEPSPLDHSEPDVHTRGLGPGSTAEEAGCDSGLCSPCFLLLPEAWKMSRVFQMAAGNFPSSLRPGPGPGLRVLGDQGCHCFTTCSTSLALACVDTGPRGAATAPLALLRGVRAGRALPTSSPTPQDHAWGHAQGDTKVCVCECVCVFTVEAAEAQSPSMGTAPAMLRCLVQLKLPTFWTGAPKSSRKPMT